VTCVDTVYHACSRAHVLRAAAPDAAGQVEDLEVQLRAMRSEYTAVLARAQSDVESAIAAKTAAEVRVPCTGQMHEPAPLVVTFQPPGRPLPF
jgi:hypothetical protein